MKNKSNRGGKREGAGRPAKIENPERVTITIDSSDKEEFLNRYGSRWQDKLREIIKGFINA